MSQAPTQVDTQGLRDTIVALVAEHRIPGISVGVVRGEELVYAEGFGLADIESGRPHDPALRQRIGSITKTMVGLCAMALVDEGRLSLDDRVVERLPDIAFHGPAGAITLRHLLTHTSGIGEMPNPEDITDPNFGLWSDAQDVPPVSRAYPKGITIEVEPGAKWAYANHAFALLGEIIARVEGRPIEEVLRRRVFQPLGMSATDCLDRPHPNLSTGYHRPPTEDEAELLRRIGREPPQEETVDGVNIRGKYQYVTGRAAGAVQSTIADMTRYASALLRQSRGIVRPQTFDAMVAPHWCPDDRLINWGLSFSRASVFGHRFFGHGGLVAGGWSSQLMLFPEDDLALLVHCNLQFDKSEAVVARIVQAVLGAPNITVDPLPVDPRILATAPGVYEAPTPGTLTNFRVISTCGRIQISARDGGLVLHARRGPWKAGLRMLPADPDDPAFFRLDTGEPEPPRLVLVLDDAGAVSGLRFDRLVHMARNPHVDPWA
ncbi:MAG: beta-lactamase family protein [Chloroflexi bacterium]|nr:beta-lactamase family protein [Chloroflexota bacterium]